MAARYLAGAAYVQVLPSLRGFQKQTATELRAIDVKATATIVPQVDKQAATKAEDDVKALTERLSKARDKEADAVGKVRVAEEKLQALRNSGKATAAQLAGAEERLASATRSSESAQRAAAQSSKALESATIRHKKAVDDFEASATRGTSALVRLWQQGEGSNKLEKSLSSAGIKALSLSTSAYSAASGVVAIGTAVPAVAALGGALSTAAGAGLILPAALVAGGIAVGALKIGMSGLGDAMKAAAEGDAKKLTEAMAKLAPEARSVVQAYIDFKPALDALKLDVQSRLFAGVGSQVRALAEDYLPIARTGLADMAGNFNAVAKEAAGFASEQQTLSDLPLIFNNSNRAMGNLVGATNPLLSILRDISAVGSDVFSNLTMGADTTAARWATFIADARASGQLEQWMVGGLQVLDQFGDVLGNVGTIFGAVFGAAAESGAGILNTLIQVTGAVAALLSSAQGQAALTTFFTTVRQVVEGLLPGVQAVGSAILDGIIELGPAVAQVAPAFSAVAISVAPLITDLASLAADILPPLVDLVIWLAPALPTLAVGFTAAVLALKGFGIVQSIIGFFKGWAAAQWSLNAAMSANPIGLIIAAVVALVAGFIYLWVNVEGFRTFWIGLWESIQQAALWAWNNVLKPTWDAIVAAIKWVGDAAVWLWTNAIQPAMQGIAAAATWLWESVLKPVFDAISLIFRVVAAVLMVVLIVPAMLAFRALAAVATWLWTTVLQPVFTAIGAIANWLWTNVIQPVVAYIIATVQSWAAVFTWLWNEVLSPAFSAIGDLFNWLWTSVIMPVVDFIIGCIQRWAAILTWLWQNVAIPVFDAIGAVISWLWTNVVQPVFAFIGAALTVLGDAFSRIYNNVIKPVWDALGTAISWVWDNVISPVFEGIKTGVDLVGQAFDKAVTWIQQVWDRMKEIAAVPVNFVINEVYNNGIRKVWNGIADFLGLGLLPQAAPIKIAGGGIFPGYAPGTDSIHALVSPGEALLVPELVRQIGPQNIMAANAAASGRPGTVVGAGPAGFSGGGVVPKFAGGGVIGDLLGWVPGIGDDIVALWESPAAWVKARIGGSGGWVDMLAAIPETLIGKAADWLMEKIDGLLSLGGGGPISGDLAGWITAAMQITGVPASWFGPLSTLIMRESGGNPNAINQWDSNAQAGRPSQGLMQTIPSTFAAYRDPRLPNEITHPIANIVAGINYINARYGGIQNVQQANAGAAPMGYDSGGFLPPGITQVYNGTGRPERVLTDDQWAAMGQSGMEGMSLVGAVVEVSDDGLMRFVDGRIEAADESTGTAVLQRRRI